MTTLFVVLFVGIFLVFLAALTMPPLVCGTFRWLPDEKKIHGPRPIIYLTVRPPGSWVRIEVGFFGRCAYVTWGHE